jgi:hypothetical protein
MMYDGVVIVRTSGGRVEEEEAVTSDTTQLVVGV